MNRQNSALIDYLYAEGDEERGAESPFFRMIWAGTERMLLESIGKATWQRF
ncbi:hypothetical protein [Marininema mesophilum]|uniref:hypothetical protein n=1 Tax=Marininema mesophilum TaxID=1048340 RepID=UPI0015A52BA3|nr:hypothetical protein [Marininema mesophilum]